MKAIETTYDDQYPPISIPIGANTRSYEGVIVVRNDEVPPWLFSQLANSWEEMFDGLFYDCHRYLERCESIYISEFDHPTDDKPRTCLNEWRYQRDKGWERWLAGGWNPCEPGITDALQT